MSAKRGRRNGALAPIVDSGGVAPKQDSNNPMGLAVNEADKATGRVFQRTAVLRWRRWVADSAEMRLEQLWLAADGSGEWRPLPIEVEA